MPSWNACTTAYQVAICLTAATNRTWFKASRIDKARIRTFTEVSRCAQPTCSNSYSSKDTINMNGKIGKCHEISNTQPALTVVGALCS